MAGKTIGTVLEESGEEITGEKNYPKTFGLLIKILDAHDVLSVQVHPDEQTCLQSGKGDPKTECWYIIDAKDGAVIYKGLKPGVNRELFAKSIKNGSCAELLNKVEVSAGECHFLPAGTPHAIGPGLLIAEIQTPSDTTYRVFDWNRIDDSGKARQLHIEDALESIHFDPTDDNLSVTTTGRLVDSDVFKVDKGHQVPGVELLLADGEMKVLMIITGEGWIGFGNTEQVMFKKGDTILIPAVFQGPMHFSADTEYLIVTT